MNSSRREWIQWAGIGAASLGGMGRSNPSRPWSIWASYRLCWWPTLLCLFEICKT